MCLTGFVQVTIIVALALKSSINFPTQKANECNVERSFITLVVILQFVFKSGSTYFIASPLTVGAINARTNINGDLKQLKNEEASKEWNLDQEKFIFIAALYIIYKNQNHLSCCWCSINIAKWACWSENFVFVQKRCEEAHEALTVYIM